MVVGDTHGTIESLKQEIKLIPGVDLILHTGDFYRDGLLLGKHLKKECRVVTGNCDHGVDGPRELMVKAGNCQILLTHGHRYSVKQGLRDLQQRARTMEANIVIFGHTHVPYLEKVGGVWFMNPGSPTYPRGGSHPGYGLIEINGAQIETRLVRLSV